MWTGPLRSIRGRLDLKKDYPEAHLNLGVALKAKGDVDGAIEEYTGSHPPQE